MKKGFTLLELLVVISIVSIVSVSSIIAFGNIDDDAAVGKRKNIYMDIQRAAILYLDLNDEWLAQFREKNEMYINVNELKNTNYISENVEDPVTHEELPSNLIVKVYIAKDSFGKEYLNSCILKLDKTGNVSNNACVANSEGINKNCCQ